MKAEIISIGTEVLLGHIVNTNASYISRKCAELGIDVYYHSTVGDNESRIRAALKRGALRSDIIFTTGGLGPTVDDITLSTVSKTTDIRLVHNKEIAYEIKKYFTRRHLPMQKEILRQARIPQGSKWFKNNVGTAPGVIIPHEKRLIICLPGPPSELQPIMEKNIIPYLKKYLPVKSIIQSKSIKLTGLPEARVNAKVKDLLRLSGHTTVGIYTRLGEVELKITSKERTRDKALRNIGKIERTIRNRLSRFIYGVDNETLEEVTGKMLQKSRCILSVAESCTGGLVAHRLTNVSGSSKYFEAGIIAYNNDIKISQLWVSPKILKHHGAVSKRCALSMARNIKRITSTDIGIGLTGIAGPKGATKNKPVGLVYIALSSFRKETVKGFFFHGKREAIKFLASQAALDLLRKHLLKLK